MPGDAPALQTELTYAREQDHRLSRAPAATLARRVEQSCEGSLAHLGVTHLALLLVLTAAGAALVAFAHR